MSWILLQKPQNKTKTEETLFYTSIYVLRLFILFKECFFLVNVYGKHEDISQTRKYKKENLLFFFSLDLLCLEYFRIFYLLFERFFKSQTLSPSLVYFHVESVSYFSW